MEGANLHAGQLQVIESSPFVNLQANINHATSYKCQPFLSEIILPLHLRILVESGKENDLNESSSFVSQTYCRQKRQHPFSSTFKENSLNPYLLWSEPSGLRNDGMDFWHKAWRGEMLIGGVELVGLVGLMAMPKEVTKWDENWAKAAGRNLKRAFTQPPVWDQDGWAINWAGHPIAGSYYYNAVRSQNATWWQSFLYAAAQSFIWEYVIEGVAEQPSIQDLISTPIGGMALGEPAHLATLSMRRNGFSTIEKIVTFLINPMFVINNGYKSPPRGKP